MILSISMVLSLMPAQGIAEAREEFFSGSIGQVEGGSNTSNATPDNTGGGGSSTANAVGITEPGGSTESSGTTEQTPQQTVQEATPAEAAPAKEIKSVETINELVTEATIEGASTASVPIVVDEAQEYVVKVTFAEKDDVQFADGKELVYTLPQGFTPSVIQPAANDAVAVRYYNEAGQRQELLVAGDSWHIDGNTVRINWKVQDEDKLSAEERTAQRAALLDALKALSDASFDVRIAGTFAKDAASVDFGNGIKALSVTPKKVETPEEEAPAKEKPDKEEEKKQEPAKGSDTSTQSTDESSSSETKKDETKAEETKVDDTQTQNTVVQKQETQKTESEQKKDDSISKEETNEIPSLVEIIQENEVIKLQIESPTKLTTAEGFKAMLAGAKGLRGVGTGSLAQFLSGASINAPTNSQGQYVVTPGTSYNITLAFAEKPDGIQFPAVGTEMTYNIPSEITQINGTGGTFVINVTDTSTGEVFPVQGNTYTIEGNTLKVTLNPVRNPLAMPVVCPSVPPLTSPL